MMKRAESQCTNHTKPQIYAFFSEGDPLCPPLKHTPLCIKIPSTHLFKFQFICLLAMPTMQNAECRMQNAKSLCRLRRLILIISEGNTAILHFAFFILHLGRQHHKLQFTTCAKNRKGLPFRLYRKYLTCCCSSWRCGWPGCGSSRCKRSYSLHPRPYRALPGSARAW